MARIVADVDTLVDQPHRHARPLGLGGIADEVYLIRERAKILPPRDRTLVMFYLEHGRSFAETARLMGVCEATVARRVGRIIRRLMDGQYITCLRNRHHLGRLGAAIARDYLIEGFAIRDIATRQGVSVYCVRKTLHTIRRLLHDNGIGSCGRNLRPRRS